MFVQPIVYVSAPSSNLLTLQITRSDGQSHASLHHSTEEALETYRGLGANWHNHMISGYVLRQDGTIVSNLG